MEALGRAPQPHVEDHQGEEEPQGAFSRVARYREVRFPPVGDMIVESPMVTFRDRSVILGVGGGIAAYKGCELVRTPREGGRLGPRGDDPQRHPLRRAADLPGAVRAPGARGPPRPAASEAGYGHLELARRADLLVIAPATANLLARLRAGMGDDAVTTTALACTCPVLLAPAMNTRMWEGPAVAGEPGGPPRRAAGTWWVRRAGSSPTATWERGGWPIRSSRRGCGADPRAARPGAGAGSW